MRWAPVILAVLAGGCGPIPLSPRGKHVGTIDTASLDEVPICGHEVAVEVVRDGGATRTIEGELLAATPEGLIVATARGLDAVPAGSVRSVEVRVLPSRAGAMAGWTAAGALSTLSHGYFLVGTFPMWLVAGIASAGNAETRGLETSVFDPALLSEYARFPQGMPPGWPSTVGEARYCVGRTAGKAPPGEGEARAADSPAAAPPPSVPQ